MSLPIELISTDFDGTLFAEFEDPPIPREFQRLIADLQKRGVKWAINTGRDMSSLMEALGRAGIQADPDFLVLVEREIHYHRASQYVALEEWNTACVRAHAELFDRIRGDLPAIVEWINARFHAYIYEDPFSDEELEAKFASLVGRYLTEKGSIGSEIPLRSLRRWHREE